MNFCNLIIQNLWSIVGLLRQKFLKQFVHFAILHKEKRPRVKELEMQFDTASNLQLHIISTSSTQKFFTDSLQKEKFFSTSILLLNFSYSQFLVNGRIWVPSQLVQKRVEVEHGFGREFAMSKMYNTEGKAAMKTQFIVKIVILSHVLEIKD